VLRPMSKAAPRPLFPMMALASVVLLLVAGVIMAALNERLYSEQKAREASVQAHILANTVSAALAFDDDRAAQDSVDALGANPEIAAVGVYDEAGRLVARLVRPGANLPARPQALTPTFKDNHLNVAVPVTEEGGPNLGMVHLHIVVDPPWRRLGRYAGVALLIGMAAVVLVVLGVGQGALARANAELKDRADELTEANSRLHDEMEERARAEEALRESQKLEAIGRLTGGVAHDFNNLLMVASSGLDLLDRTEDPARREKLKAGIRQAMERGASLTSQLLAFSRRSALKPEVVDLHRQIDGLRVLLERSLREDIRVEIDLAETLWPVEIDVNEFELAIINMGVNARDAMPNGGTVTISAANAPCPPGVEGDECVAVRVSDTGTGMSPEAMSRAFEPFFTTKPVGKGTGLGLSQVYGFARSSGGDVSLQSEPGKGTAITIYLPRTHKPLAERVAEPAAAAPGGKARGRILMVEDDDQVAHMVGEMLQKLGYRHKRAANAEEALRLLGGSQRFDLVFSDMVMPGDMDGRTLAREIQDRGLNLPVLLTTGYSEAAAAATAEGLPLLRKPYRIKELDEAVRAAMGDRAAARA